MTMRYSIAAVVALLAGAASAQTVYRCDGPGGRPVFQQHPCTAGGRTVDATPANSPMAPDPDVARQLARDRSGVMTEDEMFKRYGPPALTNTDRFGNSVSRQHVYRYADGSSRYVYTRDGIVVGLQERPAAGPGGAVGGGGEPCYSEQQIRAERVSASSITLSERQRQERERRISEMERCRR
ncbi:DUF4124 domain-containing protein [Rubrivivax sp. JA1055]|uniref:DUF4124 domain-containing protein n=2 Tax=unclassified Rubrivivax TaxID=2649762 RepID=UPI001E4649BF|nr:DUF4124 domain-containing protein [Rubrivivax sp. JA1029]MCC9595197.1 DUF4124 domain-containing protein [Rubrivivax sp. JA1055]MCC9648010.1 DUF4124 domain-containing protein [Rubrivivax sp. JA1029]